MCFLWSSVEIQLFELKRLLRYITMQTWHHPAFLILPQRLRPACHKDVTYSKDVSLCGWLAESCHNNGHGSRLTQSHYVWFYVWLAYFHVKITWNVTWSCHDSTQSWYDMDASMSTVRPSPNSAQHCWRHICVTSWREKVKLLTYIEQSKQKNSLYQIFFSTVSPFLHDKFYFITLKIRHQEGAEDKAT